MKSGAEVFRHRGAKMVCVWSRPAEAAWRGKPVKRRFPAVLFLHGFPGSEKNVDLQRALLARGIASLAMHFRGAWGSGGTYRFSNLVEDARAGLRFMKTLPGVDAERVAVFGFSMGGWTAINMAPLEPALKAVAAAAPAGGPEMIPYIDEKAAGYLARALNAPPPVEIHRDFVESVRRWDPAKSAARLRRPLLIVHGTGDAVVPVAVGRRIFAAASDPKELVLFPGAGHDFLSVRAAFVRRVAGWLARRLRA